MTKQTVKYCICIALFCISAHKIKQTFPSGEDHIHLPFTPWAFTRIQLSSHSLASLHRFLDLPLILFLLNLHWHALLQLCNSSKEQMLFCKSTLIPNKKYSRLSNAWFWSCLQQTDNPHKYRVKASSKILTSSKFTWLWSEHVIVGTYTAYTQYQEIKSNFVIAKTISCSHMKTVDHYYYKQYLAFAKLPG